MKTKQLIERNLPFSGKYVYLDIIRGSVESGQCTICDNCNHVITNMVKIADNSNGKILYIGTDCAETLSKAGSLFNNGISTDFQVDIYSYNKAARFITELNKGKTYTDNGYTAYVTTDKGKEIDCYLHDLKRWFPAYI